MHELHDISDLDPDGLPSSRSLAKATLIALAIAVALLVAAILPAEYGIDPTGIGAKLGLTKLHAVDAPTAAKAPQTAAQPAQVVGEGPVLKAAGAPKSNTIKLPLGPGQGAEIKAVMQEGQGFVFHWQADGGPVHFDMHGEPPNAGPNEFTSYWIADQQQQAGGAFTAPFNGTHGWYWKNNGDQPVTIQLSLNGFYDSVFMP